MAFTLTPTCLTTAREQESDGTQRAFTQRSLETQTPTSRRPATSETFFPREMEAPSISDGKRTSSSRTSTPALLADQSCFWPVRTLSTATVLLQPDQPSPAASSKKSVATSTMRANSPSPTTTQSRMTTIPLPPLPETPSKDIITERDPSADSAIDVYKRCVSISLSSLFLFSSTHPNSPA